MKKKIYSYLATLSALSGAGAIVFGLWMLSPPVAISVAGAFGLIIAFFLEVISLKAGKR